MRKSRLFLSLAILFAAGCVMPSSGQSSYRGITPALPQSSGAARFDTTNPALLGGGKIKHVVIIFQENRSVDNLFNGLPGADTASDGKNSHGQVVKLQPIRLTAPYDISHTHRAFETEYGDGKLDGWNDVRSFCKPGRQCPPPGVRAYGYVPRHEVEPYFTMAQSYAFANHMFQTNEGPSFPAHQYILSGTSTVTNGSSLRAAENPITAHREFTGGCDSPPGSRVRLIDPAGRENRQMYPCFARQALIDLVEAKGLTWHYYQAHLTPNLWAGPDAIRHIRKSPEYALDVVAPSSRVLTDIGYGNLANVVWVTPWAAASDHAGETDGSGPSWVAAIVNAIGKSPYWDNTAIFVTWDDWGGWYDHVKPPQYNSYELGFRVPLIVISAYTPQGYISRKQHEFGSLLKFTERTFALGSLGTTDVRADDLSDCFNFARPPRRFKVIDAPRDKAYFLGLQPSNANPDDDF